MQPVYFVDTAFLFALLNKSDDHHNEALKKQKFISGSNIQLVLTEYILVELANGLSSIRFREIAVKTIKLLQQSNSVKIIKVSEELLAKGLSYYEQHKDKEWSLTDCISFLVMKEYNIQSALTTDKHFIQAGFENIMYN